jgi:hypothetical protein
MIMRHCSIPTSAALLALLAIACGPPKQPEEVALWTIDPVISLGVEQGDTLMEFGRVSNALKLSDGRIAVADFGNTAVRVFNPNGTHALTIGRRGNGPGELPSLTRLAVLPGDTILAGGAVRVNRYAPEGNVLGQQNLDWSGLNRPPFQVEAAHPLGGGRYLLYMIRTSTGEAASDKLHRNDNLWLVWRGSLEDSDTLGLFPGLEQINFTENNERYTSVPAFPASTQYAISRDWIVVADLASDSVLRYDVKKGRSRWIHLPLVKQPVSDSVLAELEEKGCHEAPDVQRCEIQRRRLPRPSHYPEMADIAVDSLGNIWVRTNPPLVRGFAEWRVFDEDGIGMARIAIPQSVRITQIGQRYIIGVATDVLGVQRVVEYELQRHILEKWKGMRIVPREEYR